ncbi:MAG TPA: radical SAM protein [Spongiibacteraceae bacterium]|nr:radical SAM protein [Spongiibacteraceae bacterium]HCS26002.1 radical SAM protein [Spongiibacteraceae bacterium]
MTGRFAIHVVELDEHGEPPTNPDTEVRLETAKSLITRNKSPDIPFTQSINPYRGCEQGCVYCFARPSHSYLDLSPGLDFETRISAKINAPELLAQELSRPGYRCEPIALGINTDAYQPAERRLEITRKLLSIALDFKQPLSIITKSGLILRDTDLLTQLAQDNLIQVTVSMTTLSKHLKRTLEPRTASPAMRLRVIEQLSRAGVPVKVLVAPVIPLINEPEIEAILAAVAGAGATGASYILLRLPHEVAPLFLNWLQQHFPERAAHVESRIRALRGGKLYDSEFGSRMRGEGVYADLIRQRFMLAARKLGLTNERHHTLDSGHFRNPSNAQMALW